MWRRERTGEAAGQRLRPTGFRGLLDVERRIGSGARLRVKMSDKKSRPLPASLILYLCGYAVRKELIGPDNANGAL